MNMSLDKYFNQEHKSKADYEKICQLIIEQGSKKYATLLLKNEQFYSILNISRKVTEKLQILDKLDESTIKIIEIISFVKFSNGNAIDFFHNLIYFQFHKLNTFTLNDKLQLQQIIGLIISDFWWQYEYFKINTEKNDPQNYQMMCESILKYQSGNSQILELKILSYINKEIKTIINNSTSQFNDYQKQSDRLDLFFLVIIDRGTIDYKTITSYTQSKSLFSKKYRCLYFRILFHYISLRLFDHQTSNQIVSQTDDLIDLFLKNNVLSFQKEAAQLKPHFDSINQLQHEVIQNLSVYNLRQFNTLYEFLQWKDLPEFSNQFLKICCEKILQVFQDQYLLLKLYNILLFKEWSFQNQLIKHVAHEFNDQLEQQLQWLFTYLTNKSKNQISVVFKILENNLLLSNKERKCLNNCFLLKGPESIECCQQIILFLKISSQQDVKLFLKQQPAIINTQLNNFEKFSLKSIINQKRLKNIVFLFIQTYLEANHNETLFSIINQLMGQIYYYQTQDLSEFFYITFCKLQYHQLQEISTIQTGCSKEEVFEMQLRFLKYALRNLNQEDKLVILNNIEFVSFFVQDLHIDFLKQHINESPESLILYLQILFQISNNNENLIEQFSLELYRKDFMFYQKHIRQYYFSDKFAFSEPNEIALGRNEAEQFSILILKNLNLFNYIQGQNQIRQLIQSETISSKEFVIKLEKSDSIQMPEQFFQYTTNQLNFIQTKVNLKIGEIKSFFQGKINEANQSMKILELMLADFKTIFKNMNSENYKSCYYFEENLGLSNQKANFLLHQIFNDYVICQDTAGVKLFKKEFLNFFGEIVLHEEMNINQKFQYIDEELEMNEEHYKISCLHSFMETLVTIFEEKFLENRTLNDQFLSMNIDDQLGILSKSLIGCKQLCPICKKKCDQIPTVNHQHKCENGHQLRAMGGILVNNMPSLFSCEDLEDDFEVFDLQINSIIAWRILKQNYENWNFSSFSTMELRAHQVYLTKMWDLIYGEYYCSQLRVKFSLKSNLDIQNYRGKNIVLSQQQQVKKFHYILVLDDSGSMAGTRFKNAIQGAKQCLQLFVTNNAIRLTIIMFNNNARIVVGQKGPEQINVQSQIEKIQFAGGGTNFNSAFQEIFSCLNKCQEHFDKHIILFYTDGEAAYPHQALSNLMTLNDSMRKKVSIIICCEGSDQESLMDLQDFFNTNMEEGKLFQKVRPEDLGNIWTENVTVTQLRREPC